MPSLGKIFAVALLALGGVDAKRKDKIRFNTYGSKDCGGHALDNQFSELTLYNGESPCVAYSGYSIMLQKHEKDKYNKWIDEANSGWTRCYVQLSPDESCTYAASLPWDPVEEIGKCRTVGGSNFIRFWCQPVTHLTTSIHTTVVPATYTISPSTTKLVSKLNPRAEPTHKAALEPRKAKHNKIGVWLEHPWTGAATCYLCWTKKKNKFDKFACRSDVSADCGDTPGYFSYLAHKATTTTRTIRPYPTIAAEVLARPYPTHSADKRSPHKRVVLYNPYFDKVMVCADAEWESIGEKDEEARIQKVKPVGHCDGKDATDINIYRPTPQPSRTVTETVILTYPRNPDRMHARTAEPTQ